MRKRVVYCLVFLLLTGGFLYTSFICFGGERDGFGGVPANRADALQPKAGMSAALQEGILDSAYERFVSPSQYRLAQGADASTLRVVPDVVPDGTTSNAKCGLAASIQAQGADAAASDSMQGPEGAHSQVASEDEMAAARQVGEAGMIAVSGKDVKDGTYDITVDSSSSMFKVTKAELTVENGKMSAVMTMSGKGYLMVFLGTGEEAVAADEAQYIPFAEGKDGAHTFEIPVEALNQVISLTSFSKAKEKWYDRQLVFRADSLPEDAVLADLDAGKLGYEDGEYAIAVDLAGGTGKASIASPVQLTVTDGEAIARIEWSSPDYDYMIVSGRKYFPVAGEENSVFEIPVSVFGQPMAVIADTTAMSQPHEIQYTLTFHADTIEKEGGGMLLAIAIAVIFAVAVAAVFIIASVRKTKKKHEKNI